MSSESNNTTLKTMRVLRQALALGSLLVVMGIVLSYTVHPLFILLPLVVSGGLMFSAVAGWCPMIYILERTPWNKNSR